jgi:hypothetical protein
MSSWTPGSRPDFSAQTVMIQMQERSGPSRGLVRGLVRKEGLTNLQFSVNQSKFNFLDSIVVPHYLYHRVLGDRLLDLGMLLLAA